MRQAGSGSVRWGANGAYEIGVLKALFAGKVPFGPEQVTLLDWAVALFNFSSFINIELFRQMVQETVWLQVLRFDHRVGRFRPLSMTIVSD